jgi:hypothetical protein
MADAVAITSIISDPLIQYGVLGIFAAYCLYTDWTTRRDSKAAEKARIEREFLREAKAEQREKDCIARIQQLENRHQQQMLGPLIRNNTLFELLLQDRGIEIPKTPHPQEYSHEPSDHR